MTRIVPVLIAVVAGAGLGCSSYHYVRSSDTGGTIALDGNRDSAMGKAKDAMESHCRYGYETELQGRKGGAGFYLYNEGWRPPSIHMFYGFLILFVYTFAYIYRVQMDKRPALYYGLLLLFVMGLGIRAWSNVS